jgi:3-phosphoglycerate kinase
LFKSKKVTQQDYDEKTTSIQVKYNNELKEIEEIKKLLRMNVLKAENMALKTNEDIALVSHIGKVDDELLDRIFGQDL